MATLTALSRCNVFPLVRSQTEGLIGFIIPLLGLDMAVPNHTTRSRRVATLEVPHPRSVNINAGPNHLLVDSTGLKLCRPGEWLVKRHGTKCF